MLGLRLRFLKVVLLTCRADGCGTEGSQEGCEMRDNHSLGRPFCDFFF